MIVLTDDGTLDTVLRCSICDEEFRFNYNDTFDWDDEPCEHGVLSTDGCAACYTAFVTQSIDDVTDEHECRRCTTCGVVITEAQAALSFLRSDDAIAECATCCSAKLTKEEDKLRIALRELYNRACHHPRCERSDDPHMCSCGVSAALELARNALGIALDSQTME